MIKPTKWPVHPATTQISLSIHLVWSESSLWALRIPKVSSYGQRRLWSVWADAQADHSGRMPRLIWVFAGRTGHFVAFVVLQLRNDFKHVTFHFQAWLFCRTCVWGCVYQHGNRQNTGRSLYILHTSIGSQISAVVCMCHTWCRHVWYLQRKKKNTVGVINKAARLRIGRTEQMNGLTVTCRVSVVSHSIFENYPGLPVSFTWRQSINNASLEVGLLEFTSIP